MPAINIAHININAPHDLLLEVRDFYCKFVGLKVGDRPPFESKGFWLYADDHPIVHLVFGPEDANYVTTQRTTMDHVALFCSDYRSMRAALDDAGVAYSAREVPLLRNRQLFFKDPAGNGVELIFSADDL